MLFYKDVFHDTDKDDMTSLPSPLEWWKKGEHSKTQFKINTEGSWQSTEILGHLAFFSSSEYLCALISPLACGGYDTPIVWSSQMTLDEKLYQMPRMHPKLPTGFPQHLLLSILMEEFLGNSNKSSHCPVSPSWGNERTLRRDALQDHEFISMYFAVLYNHTETSNRLGFPYALSLQHSVLHVHMIIS